MRYTIEMMRAGHRRTRSSLVSSEITRKIPPCPPESQRAPIEREEPQRLRARPAVERFAHLRLRPALALASVTVSADSAGEGVGSDLDLGEGQLHLASGLGHVACRRGYSVLFVRTEDMLKQLRASRLDHSTEREMRRLIAVDLLVLDDFGLDTLDPTESRDIYEVLVERHQRRSTVVTSNRAPEEWLSTMSDPLRAQSAIDRLTNAAYESSSTANPTAGARSQG